MLGLCTLSVELIELAECLVLSDLILFEARDSVSRVFGSEESLIMSLPCWPDVYCVQCWVVVQCGRC